MSTSRLPGLGDTPPRGPLGNLALGHGLASGQGGAALSPGVAFPFRRGLRPPADGTIPGGCGHRLAPGLAPLLFPILLHPAFAALETKPDREAGKRPSFADPVEEVLAVGIGDQVLVVDEKKELGRVKRPLTLRNHLRGIEELETLA